MAAAGADAREPAKLAVSATTIARPGCFEMTDTLPDRPASTRTARTTTPILLERPIGVRFNGRERNDVEEYCVSEG